VNFAEGAITMHVMFLDLQQCKAEVLNNGYGLRQVKFTATNR
jgi:hypothetical protein